VSIGSEVKIATTDEALRRCFPVMQLLRPHLSEETFIARVNRQREAGYRLAYCEESSAPVCVAGFRLGENLAWGRFLYVDDLVTSESVRSRGLGRSMLAWLQAYAKKHGCEQLHLDSGMQRKRAHRFYEREGMQASGYHFVTLLQE
jgi:GNAT superfamily N-acetyltransferase